MGTFTMCPAWTHRAHCDQIDGHFVKELNMSPLADGWLHCLKNHNVITMYLLGKWPLAPSVCGLSLAWIVHDPDNCDFSTRNQRGRVVLTLPFLAPYPPYPSYTPDAPTTSSYTPPHTLLLLFLHLLQTWCNPTTPSIISFLPLPYTPYVFYIIYPLYILSTFCTP